MKTKLEPRIYEEAAARILEQKNSLCCVAVSDVVDTKDEYDYRKHVIAFHELFIPEFHPWMCAPFWDYPSTSESREARVIALLLMAEIANGE